MDKDLTTLTVEELISELDRLQPDAKVYISRDSEGNSYGTINEEYSLRYDELDNVVVIYPFVEYLEDEDIEPEMIKDIEEGFKSEA